MCGCGNNSLCYRYSLANRAFLAVCKTCGSTGSCLAAYRNFVMRGSGNSGLSNRSCITNRTLFAVIEAGSGTSRCYTGYSNLCVTCCRSFVSDIAVATVRASVGGISVTCTSRSRYCGCITVTERRNNCLFYGNNAANRALLSVGKTCFSIGCCLAGNSYLGVSVSREVNGYVCVRATCTGVRGISFVCAGGVGCY